MAFNNWCAHLISVLDNFVSTYSYAISFCITVFMVLALFAWLFLIWRAFFHD